MHLKTSMASIAACFITLFSATLPANARETDEFSPSTGYNKLLFLENKGQIVDQHHEARPDIDFRLSGGDVNIFIGDGQIHYQWSKPNNSVHQLMNNLTDHPGREKDINANSSYELYRLDAVLIGANTKANIKVEEPDAYYENYYLAQCPNGATVHSFKKITYQDIYPNIDWVFYVNGNQLKYDFVIHKGGNPSDIKLRYDGATSLNITDGALTVNTPFGTINEQKPYSYDLETQQEIASGYVLTNNVLSFDITSHENGIVIDPTIGWGTYYSLPNQTGGYAVAAEPATGKGYLAGSINNIANVATFGTAYQYTYGGGGTDGYIVKFNVAGVRDWATYYGGENSDDIYGAICDANGNLYVAGSTNSITGSAAIASSGSHQSSNGNINNPRDGFVAKFSAAGQRTWGTYYGGSSNDYATSVAVDKNGNVFIAGQAGSTNGTTIATSGAHQTASSPGFLAKFNSSGTRQWGTYYGNNGNEIVNSVACDTSGNVYIGGFTQSYQNIATTGTFQSTNSGGSSDGFIAKFNSSGQRQWGSYYGGTGLDNVMVISCDRYNNVFIAGKTSSTGMASTGAFQTSLSGNSDGFLARFNASTGQRVWGTYYGGSGDEDINGIYAGHDRKIYISGNTSSSTGIATAGNYQTTYGGNTAPSGSGDGFLTKFSLTGSRLWATYYGGAADESNVTLAFGGGKLYIGGTTTSANNIGTINGYQNFLAGSPPPVPPSPFPPTGFLAQFEADTAVYIDEIFMDTLTCLADTLYIKYAVTNNFRPGNTFTLQRSDASGSFANPVNINTVTTGTSGNFKYWIADTTTPNIGYRIRIVSSAFADTSFDNGKDIRVSDYPHPGAIAVFPICANGDLQLADNGISPSTTDYLWTGPGNFSIGQSNYNRPNVQITDSGWYYLTGNNYGCITTDSVHVLIYNKPNKPTVHSNSPVCATDTLKVWATSTTPGVTSWNWQKPSGFIQFTTGDTTIPVAALTDAGVYKALAIAGGCPSDPDSTIVVIESKASPTVTIAATPNSAGPWVNITFSVTGSSNEGTSPTYQWTKNGVDIPNATGVTYMTTTATDLQTGDTICVRMNSSVGCAIPQTVKSCVGIAIDMGVKELAAAGTFGLYPNPNNGSFTLNGKTVNDKAINMQVMNVVGQVVFEDAVTPVNKLINKQLNVTDLPEGVYMLHMKTDEGMSAIKFTIKK